MAGEWRISSLAEAPLEIIDGDRGVNYPKQEEFSGTGHCLFLNAGNVSANGFNFSDCAFITAQKDAALRKGKLVRNDVVLTTRGTVGNSAFFDRSVPFDHIRINSGMVILRPLPEYLHPRYLYLFVRSPLSGRASDRKRTAATSDSGHQSDGDIGSTTEGTTRHRPHPRHAGR
jgi:type I restriction enzyme S subunit